VHVFFLLGLLLAGPALAQDCGIGSVSCAADLASVIGTPAATTSYAITDTNAVARDPATWRPTGEVLAPGTEVEVLETRRRGRREYVRVREVIDAGAVSGEPSEWWTARSNLGSTKDFDDTLAPAVPVPTDGLRGLDRVMQRSTTPRATTSPRRRRSWVCRPRRWQRCSMPSPAAAASTPTARP